MDLIPRLQTRLIRLPLRHLRLAQQCSEIGVLHALRFLDFEPSHPRLLLIRGTRVCLGEILELTIDEIVEQTICGVLRYLQYHCEIEVPGGQLQSSLRAPRLPILRIA